MHSSKEKLSKKSNFEYHSDVVWIKDLLNLFRFTSYVWWTDRGRFFIVVFYSSYRDDAIFAGWLVLPSIIISNNEHLLVHVGVTTCEFGLMLQAVDITFLDTVWMLGTKVIWGT